MTYQTAMRLIVCVVVFFCLLPSASHAQMVPQSKEQMQLSFAPVVKKAVPAVVNIYTKRRVQVNQGLSPFMDDPFFQQFFGNNPAFRGPSRERVVSSLGSGVIIQPDGLIVTSHHVIRDAQEIIVVLSDKRELEAKVTMRDPQSDLAFLKVSAPSALPYLSLRDSDTLQVGDLVLAIGNPFGVGQTVTQGIISALARKAEGVSDYQFFIQTDAAINPGNSGGALVDLAGNLIGVNTAIYSRSGGSMGIGFAIPANMVRSLMNGKVEDGKVVRPWVGLSVQPVTSDIADSIGLAAPRGVMVRGVKAGSSAEKAGLRVGDVILAVDGHEVSTENEIRYRISLRPIGENADFKVLRGGSEISIAVPMEATPEAKKLKQVALSGSHPLAGLVVIELTKEIADEIEVAGLTLPAVVVVDVQKSAQQLALAPGDVILEINNQKISDVKSLEQILKKAARSWQIVYKRGNNVVTLTIR
jgi:serine protease Do